MKLCKLKIKGLNSFSDVTEINFEEEPLNEASLVAITGPTGSGKTTLLDAICVALYNKTPRLSGRGSQNPNHLISHSQNEGSAELHFIANGTRYVASWSAKRGKSPSVRLEKRLKNAAARELISDRLSRSGKAVGPSQNTVSEEVEAILGLDFDAFKRSVMLAQGEFAAFLKAKGEERRVILEATGGIGIYDLLKDALNEKKREVEDAHSNIQSKLDGIPEATPEQLSEKKKQLAQSQKEAEKLDSQNKSLQGRITKEEQRKRDHGALQSSEERHAELIQQKPRIDALKDELEAAQRADKLRAEKLAYDTAKKNRDEASKELQKAGKEKRDAEQNAQEDLEDFHKKERSYLESLSELHSRLSSEHSDAESALEEANRRLNNLTSANTQQDWEEIKKQAQSARSIAQGFETLSASLADANEESQRKTREKAGYEAKLVSVETDLKAKEQTLQDAKQHVQECEEARKLAMLANPIQELRLRLQDGEACLVCGATDHPVSDHPPHEDLGDQLADAETALSAAKEKEQSAQKQLNAARITYAQNEQGIKSAISEIEKVAEKIKKSQSDQTELQAEWEKRYPRVEISSAWIDEQITKADDGIGEIRSAETACKDAQGKRDSLGKDLATYKRKVEDETDAFLRHGLDTAAVIWPDERLPISELEESALSKETVRAEAKEQSQTSAGVRSQKQTLYDLRKKTYGDSVDTFEKAQRTYLDKLAEANFESPEQHEAASRSEEDQKDIGAEIDGYENELRTLEEKIKELREQFENAPFVEKLLKQLETGQEQVQDKLIEANRRIGSIGRDIAALKENIQKREEIQKQLEEARQEMDRWLRLHETIPSNKLRDFAVEFLFQQMISLANEQLEQLTEQRYQLKVEGIGNLAVIDCWNANEERPVETLSGGESFLTSLALALALSELSQGRAQLHSLFLDEGFGTLDAQTLDTAIAALEGLRMQGRNIYLISHIQELTRRLPVKIEVKKRGNGSSTINIPK